MTFAKNFLKFFAADYMDLNTIEKIDSYHKYLDDNYMDMTSEEIANFEAKLSHIYNEAIVLMHTNFNVVISREDICYHNTILSTRFRKTWLMAKMETEKNIQDACQSYEYQMNTLSSASQTPFSTISFDIPKSWYSEEILKAYLRVRMRGIDSTGKIAVFPKISTFVVDGVNLRPQDSKFYLTKLVAKCISKAYYPDILHVKPEDYELGNYYSRMGCRSRVSHELRDGEYRQEGLFNTGVHSLNVVQPAYMATTIDEYFEKLKEYSNLIEQAIIWRFNYVKNMKAEAAPILFMHGGLARLKADDTIEELIKTNYASISYGYVGISDAVNVLLGENAYETTEAGKALGLRIMKFMTDEVARIKKETGLPVSLYGTPKHKWALDERLSS